MRGSNGIREHEMVVRAMPGGPQGIEIKDGKLHYQGTVDLKSIRQELNDQLIADEEKQKSKFSSKPLDLSHLRLVAFVQNDQSREIYQSKMVPFPTPSGCCNDRQKTSHSGTAAAGGGGRQETLRRILAASGRCTQKSRKWRSWTACHSTRAAQCCLVSLLLATSSAGAASRGRASPKSLDPRIEIRLFAETPQIVTPTDVDVDHLGRVWAIESNTHFRPAGYKGIPAIAS